MTVPLLAPMVETELDRATDVVGVGRVVRHAARAAAQADGATFVLAEGDQCFYEDEDAIAPLWKGQRFPMTECVSGWAMRHDEAVAITDLHLDDRVPLAAYLPTFVRSLLVVPMGVPAMGAIGAYWAHRHTATPEEVDRVTALAAAAAAALERVGLRNAPWAPNFELDR
jgi:GAF domain-containing protein